MSEHEAARPAQPQPHDAAPPAAHEPHLPEGQEPAPPGTWLMGILRWLLVLGAAAMAIGAIGHTRGWFGAGVVDRRAYTCPMHPQVHADHAGSCPICGMDLVPVEDIEPPPPSSQPAPPGLVPIVLHEPDLSRSGARTAVVEAATLQPTLRTIATVEARDQGKARIDARFAGWLDRLTVGELGAAVGRGQIIARIVSPELATAQQDYLSARALDGAGGGELAAAARRRLELLGFTAADLATLDRTGAPLAALEVRAPVGGTVVARPAVVGAYLEPGTPLVELADLSTVWVTAEVYELDLAAVSVGQAAVVRSAAVGERTWTGKVARVLPVVDPATRSGQARIAVANRDRALVPGMAAEVELALPPWTGPVVPRSAVVETGQARYLFVLVDNRRFEPRLVTTGPAAGDRIAITSGVAVGERVVTSGNFAIDSESRLRAGQRGDRVGNGTDDTDAVDAGAAHGTHDGHDGHDGHGAAGSGHVGH